MIQIANKETIKKAVILALEKGCVIDTNVGKWRSKSSDFDPEERDIEASRLLKEIIDLPEAKQAALMGKLFKSKKTRWLEEQALYEKKMTGSEDFGGFGKPLTNEEIEPYETNHTDFNLGQKSQNVNQIKPGATRIKNVTGQDLHSELELE